MTHQPRILVLGAAGQLGRELQRSFFGAGEVIAANRERVDLSGIDQAREAIRNMAPDIILNAAAYTAVDRAESETEAAMAINGHVPGMLAEEAKRTGALLVHYSTDYVFDGSKAAPWTEEDQPNPLNAYGASKLAGEKAIQQVGGKYLIFRISWIYGPHGKNFLLTMLRLSRERKTLQIVDDQFGAPTSSIQIANATRTIVDRAQSGHDESIEQVAGLYHMSCSGRVSWCGFAQAIISRLGDPSVGDLPVVNPIASEDYPTAAVRPRNSLLSNTKLEGRFKVSLPPWEVALDEAMRKMGILLER
jgi:dTDP-4-dehydrorhamnose reductase